MFSASLKIQKYFSNCRKYSTIEKVYDGSFIHSLSMDKLEVVPQGRIGVDKQGKIVFVAKNQEEKIKAKEQFPYRDSDVVTLGKKFLIPGFIDTHAHAPQYVFSGSGTGVPLLQWLDTYTFNYESKFKDTEYANRVYSKAIARHSKYGSTSTVFYGTIHKESSKLLADLIAQSGQRGLIGKINMDRNSPQFYVEETKQSIIDTEDFVQYVKALPQFRTGLVKPVITPRFAPSCSSELMRELGKLAHKHDLPIQSHISENTDEVKWIKELFPNQKSYAEVYLAHGLLTPNSIMGHGVYLTKEELKLFKEIGATVSHCPLSNSVLYSGFMSVRLLQENGVRISLGTDVAGGPSPSMLEAIRHAIMTSSVHSVINHQKNLTFKEAFYLATLAGAEALRIENLVGNFITGKEFDALLIDPYASDSPFDIFEDTIEQIFEKFIFLGDDRNIHKMFVQGKEIKHK